MTPLDTNNELDDKLHKILMDVANDYADSVNPELDGTLYRGPDLPTAKAEILKLIAHQQAISELKGRIAELKSHGNQWRVWEYDTEDVKLADVLSWYDVRIEELEATLNQQLKDLEDNI